MIAVGGRVCWRGNHGSRIGRVVRLGPSGVVALVLAEDNGAEVYVPVAFLVPMHDEKVAAPTNRAEGQSA